MTNPSVEIIRQEAELAEYRAVIGADSIAACEAVWQAIKLAMARGVGASEVIHALIAYAPECDRRDVREALENAGRHLEKWRSQQT